MSVVVVGADEWAFVIGLEGSVLFAAPRTAHHAHASDAQAPTFGFAKGASAGPFASLADVAQADGSGLGFDPDPLTTAGVDYGGAYADNDDADTPELTAARVELTLPEITQRGGLWHLEGPYVVIDGTLGARYSPPSETDPNAFRYTRADDRFEAVMVYHHVDDDQRRVQSLDVGRPIFEQPIRINPQGDLSDNSRFFTNDLTIRMGIGAIDDAEDAMVIRHEYAHALLNADAPSLYQRQDGSALHEGWADYWAASWRASKIEAGEGSGDVRDVFPWDGNNGCWQGRRLDHPGSYPGNTGYPAPGGGCGNFPTIYQRGILWATTLFDLRAELGADVMDRLVVASHAFVGNVSGVPAFESAAQALLAADEALYDGRHRRTLALGLSARGYVDASAAGPDLAHSALRSTEQSGGTRRVAALVSPASATARLVYRIDGGADQTLTLAPVASSDSVAVDLPIPSGPATITYFLMATDPAGRTTRLPVDGAFVFQSGPDTTPPTLDHRPPGILPASAWPARLSVDATDALGVANVRLNFVYASQGQTLREGELAMERTGTDLFQVRLPDDLPQAPRAGDVVTYSFVAVDSAQAANSARLPTSDAFVLTLVDEGDLFIYSFETNTTEGFRADDAWTRTSTAANARSGERAWQVQSPSAGTSALDLPPFDLPDGGAWLAFWHRYDASAGSGGYVEARVGEADWQRLVPGVTDWGAPGGPTDGYPATVGGLGVWSGDSRGWQRAAVLLPGGDGVRVRLVFASDGSPARWSVDDVSVATDSIRDASDPVASVVPAAIQTREARIAPTFAIDVQDDQGVAAVYVDVEAGGGSARFRLDQTRATPQSATFAAALPDSLLGPLGFAAPGPAAGSSLRYAFELVDIAGNRVRAPSGERLRLDFRTLDVRDALAGATPVGAWRNEGSGFRASARSDGRTLSALLLPPLDLPANADASTFALAHRFDLPNGSGAQLSLSADSGAWQSLEPIGGYTSTFSRPDHPLDGQPVWTGSQPDTTIRFDLSQWAGQTVRIRALIAHTDASGEWSITAADRLIATPNDTFSGPPALRLDIADTASNSRPVARDVRRADRSPRHARTVRPARSPRRAPDRRRAPHTCRLSASARHVAIGSRCLPVASGIRRAERGAARGGVVDAGRRHATPGARSMRRHARTHPAGTSPSGDRAGAEIPREPALPDEPHRPLVDSRRRRASSGRAADDRRA